MKDKKLLECLFGHHSYSKDPVKDKYEDDVHLCSVCKKHGYCDHSMWGDRRWYMYDNDGNCICIEFSSDGEKYWFDVNGDCQYIESKDGHKRYLEDESIKIRNS